MNTRTMYAIAFTVYLVFVAALIASIFLLSGNEESQLLAIHFIATIAGNQSSGLMVCTLILAVVFMRDKSSERYRELYMEQDKDWEKKD